jgi:hypothetical protein
MHKPWLGPKMSSPPISTSSCIIGRLADSVCGLSSAMAKLAEQAHVRIRYVERI